MTPNDLHQNAFHCHLVPHALSIQNFARLVGFRCLDVPVRPGILPVNRTSYSPAMLAFEPSLTVGESDAACQSILKAYRSEFVLSGPELTWEKLRNVDASVVADFDGDGRDERLVFDVANTRGSHEAYAIFAVDAAAELPDGFSYGMLLLDTPRPPLAVDAVEALKRMPRISPARDGQVSLGRQAGDWSYMPVRMVEINHEWLSIEQTQWSGREAYFPVDVYGIGKGFLMSKRCRIELRDSAGKSPEQSLSSRSRVRLRGLLDDMSGTEGDCGTGSFLTGRIHERRRSERRALVRPWGLQKSDLAGFKSLLGQWRLESPGNVAVADAIPGAIAEWRRELAGFYRDKFKVTGEVADDWADAAIGEELAAGFSIYLMDFTDESDRSRIKLRSAVLAARTRRDIDRAIREARSAGNSGRATDAIFSDVLHFAVLKPAAIRPLIASGYSVDAANAFGKTALMYAAQYNSGRALDALLESGAKTGLATRRPRDTCGYSLAVENVTALHYAVRYASHAVIKKLIAAGAPLEVKDSRDRTPLDWLHEYGEGNRNLSPAARSRLERILLPPKGQR